MPRAAGGNFGVAVQQTDDLRGPFGNFASLRISAAVQIDADQVITEDESQAVDAAIISKSS